MEPSSLKKAEKILNSIKYKSVVIPPFIYLEKLAEIAKRKNLEINFGSQNCFWENEGAYTGEISPLMLKNLGVKYIIIGHSERRFYFKETDVIIAKKLKLVVENKVTPILCVGETLEQRENKLTEKIIKNQLEDDLEGIKSLKVKNLIIAYEPRWAIGNGHYCPVEEASKVHNYIHKILKSKTNVKKFKIIYGGSVNSKNISSFLEKKEIDGVLIGHAGIEPKEIKKMASVSLNYELIN